MLRACVSVLLCSLSAFGADPPAKDKDPAAAARKAWDARVEKERAAKVDKAKSDLEAAEKAVKDLRDEVADLNKKYFAMKKKDPKLFDQIAGLNTAVDVAAAKVGKAEKAHKEAQQWEPRTRPQDLKEGDVTKLGSAQDRTPIFTTLQVIDETAVILSFEKELYWVECPTKGMVDGRKLTVEGVVECLGTKKYATAAGGTRTVMAFRAYPEPPKK